MNPKPFQSQLQVPSDAQPALAPEPTPGRRSRGRAALIVLIDVAVMGATALALRHSVHLALVVVELAVFAVSVPHALVSLHRAIIGDETA